MRENLSIDHHPEDDKPQYVKDLEDLRDSGGLKRVANLIKTNADVWIKRSNGNWQICKAYELGYAGLSTGVKWFDQTRQKELGKHVDTKDFLRWQDEAHD